MSTDTVRARIDPCTKRRATDALDAMGLSVSGAIRMLLTRIAEERRLPFAAEVPNAITRAAMEEARSITHARFKTPEALFDALEKGR